MPDSDAAGLEYEITNTVCPATRLRQEAARKLADQVDVMLVIGGRNSANTRHLAELCQERSCKVYAVKRLRNSDRNGFLPGTEWASLPEHQLGLDY